MFSDKKFFAILFLALIISGIVLYYPTTKIGFLSDDWGYVYLARENTLPQAFKYFWTADAIGNGTGNFRPLQSFLTVAVWRPFLDNPQVIHYIGLFLHVTVSFLIGLLFYLLFRQRMASLVPSFLFLFFPLNVEVISWLCAAWNTLPALTLLLLVLILYLRNEKKSQLIWLCVLGFFSLLAKEFAIFLPLFVLLLDIVRQKKPRWLAIGAFVLMDIAYLVYRFLIIGKLGGYGTTSNFSSHALFSFLKLPYAYAHNFFNQFAVPHEIKYLIFGIIIILFLAYLFVLKTNIADKNGRKRYLKNIVIFIILIYGSSLLTWNMVNPLDIQTAHSRFLYLSTVWFVLFIGYLFVTAKNSIFKYILIAYVAVMPCLAFFQMQPWIIAGASTQKINASLVPALKSYNENETIEITNLPDNYEAAFIYRNGIDYAVAFLSHTKKGYVIVKETMQPRINLPVIIKKTSI